MTTKRIINEIKQLPIAVLNDELTATQLFIITVVILGLSFGLLNYFDPNLINKY